MSSPVVPPPVSLPKRLARFLRRGDHMIWLTGGALGLAVLLITGLLLIVVANGITFFWPFQVITADRADGTPVLGVITNRQEERRDVDGDVVKTASTQFKVGNRELYGFDFLWVHNQELSNFRVDPEVVALERQEYGDFYGFLRGIERDGQPITDAASAWELLNQHQPEARRLAENAREIQRDEIGEVNAKIQRANLRLKVARQKAGGDVVDPALQAAVDTELARLQEQYEHLRTEAERLTAESERYAAVMETVDGQEKRVPLAAIVRAFRPNQMSWGDKLLHYASRAAEFVYGEPRESNTEGGVFPAIFGTVLMTIIMSVIVTPLGVVAAFYLREYARQG